MIDALIRGALKQRLVVAVVAAVLLFFGIDAARKLSLDAFPDVTNAGADRHRGPGARPRRSSASSPCRWRWR